MITRRKVQELIDHVLQDRDLMDNEENTKNAAVEPFIEMIGYNMRSLRDVRSELKTRHGNVDYALCINAEPKIFIEVKPANKSLTPAHFGQLSKYCHTSSGVLMGILTNGVEYQFYSNDPDKNELESSPFHIFNIASENAVDSVTVLNMLANVHHSQDEFLQYIENQQSISSMESALLDELANPSADVVKIFAKRVWQKQKATSANTERWTRIFAEAARNIVNADLPDTSSAPYVAPEPKPKSGSA